MTREELLEKVNQADKNEGIKISPRQLLYSFGFEKRTKYNVMRMKHFFQQNDLFTSPDFLSVYMDTQVSLKKRPKTSKKQETSEIEKEINEYDPVSRVRLLPSANRKPVKVHLDCTLQEATTLMLMHDYSQLPVMSSDYKVDGIITWETIGNNLIHGGDKTLVRDFMKKDVTEITHEMSIFDAVKIIINKEVVLVRDEKNCICGLVTSTDISEQFITISEPFLILEQIENHIRKLLNGKFSEEKLKEICVEDESSRKVESISDLTFGEYIRLMENPENWEVMDLNIDRSTFIKRLDEIRRIRNDVMHFHPDGISETDLEILRQTSSFFENLSKYMK